MAEIKRNEFNRGGTLNCTATEGCMGILCYLNDNDVRSTKGVIMLFCPICTMKHWGEASDLEKRARMLKQERRAAQRAEHSA